MVSVEETPLPGVGLRYDFVAGDGRRVGVVSRRDGHRELLVYSRADPDAASAVVRLSGEEADTLAELLGAPWVVDRIARLHDQVEGLITEGVLIATGSRFDGRTLADTETRTRTGASVIAVSRSGEIIPMPRTDFRFRAGDTIVVVGTRDGVQAAAALLAGS